MPISGAGDHGGTVGPVSSTEHWVVLGSTTVNIGQVTSVELRNSGNQAELWVNDQRVGPKGQPATDLYAAIQVAIPD
jgi:hypothetical protein